MLPTVQTPRLFEMPSWYQNHHAPDCPNDLPVGHNYKELTKDILLNHMWTNNIPSGSRPIGAVTLSTHIEEVADKTMHHLLLWLSCLWQFLVLALRPKM